MKIINNSAEDNNFKPFNIYYLVSNKPIEVLQNNIKRLKELKLDNFIYPVEIMMDPAKKFKIKSSETLIKLPGIYDKIDYEVKNQIVNLAKIIEGEKKNSLLESLVGIPLKLNRFSYTYPKHYFNPISSIIELDLYLIVNNDDNTQQSNKKPEIVYDYFYHDYISLMGKHLINLGIWEFDEVSDCFIDEQNLINKIKELWQKQNQKK